MSDPRFTTVTEIWAEYAAAAGKDLDELTDAEKRQAYLYAALDGQCIDPFVATINDWAQMHLIIEASCV